MKRPKSLQLPYLSVCLVVRNSCLKPGTFDGKKEGYGEGDGFDGRGVTAYERTLRSIRARAPNCEIVIVDTCSSDERTVELSKLYADVWEEYRGPRGDWDSSMHAVDNMAIARQRSFDLAHGSWLMWVDDDDILADPAMAEKFLRANGRYNPAPNSDSVKDRELSKTQPTLEDMLRFTDAHHPNMEGFLCPYLYRFEDNDVSRGKAITWNPRERIVRNNGKWHWAQPGHEILVAKDPKDMGKLIKASTPLYVHQKKFDDAEIQYSLDRHYAIIVKKFDAGEANIQECLYLENFSMQKCPHRRKEFALAALDQANVPFERMRALNRLGNIAADGGFHLEAVSHFSAACALTPNIPDPWTHFGSYWEKQKEWFRAADCYEKAIAAETGFPLSDIAPRTQQVDMRARAAMCLYYGSKMLTRSGFHTAAIEALEKGTKLIIEARDRPELVLDETDRREGYHYSYLIENELHALIRIRELHAHWQYLIANDETVKASQVIQLVPHNVEDHPLVIKMEKWNRDLETHLNDPESYADFYEEDRWTSTPSPEDMLTPESAESRVKFLMMHLKDHPEWKSVLEVGTFDGITAIPVMKSFPNIRYTAVEAQSDALERLRERAEGLQFADRMTFIHALDIDESDALRDQTFDAVVFHEVIEHVPDPVRSVETLLRRLKPGGGLFISTPNGAYDKGHPQNPEKRDKRGHVRAYTTRTLVDTIEAAGGRVINLDSSHMPGNFGDTLVCMSERRETFIRGREVDGGKNFIAHPPPPPVAFSVLGALWDWNASHVLGTGIGASEESIVYIARELSKQPCRDVSVYGPIPFAGGLYEEEVKDGVKYWNRDSRRRISKNSTVIVSRAPSYGAEHEFDDRILWLQDVGYGDLTPETAKDYRKIIAVSPWHKGHMVEFNKIDREKIEVIPNFVLREHFDERNTLPRPQREPHAFIYASSPDRGLITLLKLWPSILAQWPDATLRIFYGWAGAATLTLNNPTWTQRYQVIRREYERLRYQPGVVDFGRINHALLAREYQRASVWAYPTAFLETDGNAARKARAGGCVPVCTPLAGLNFSAADELTQFIQQPENFDPDVTGGKVQLHPQWKRYVDEFLDGVNSAIRVTEPERTEMAARAMETGSVEARMGSWLSVLER